MASYSQVFAANVPVVRNVQLGVSPVTSVFETLLYMAPFHPRPPVTSFVGCRVAPVVTKVRELFEWTVCSVRNSCTDYLAVVACQHARLTK